MTSTEKKPETNHQIRIEYSQNGRVLSNELFRAVPFYWSKIDELDARLEARRIAQEYGCGMADVYILDPHGNRTGIYSCYGVDQPVTG